MKRLICCVALTVPVSVLVLAAGFCADPKAELVIERQKAYFAAITTLEYSATLVENFNAALEAANGGGPAYARCVQDISLDGARYLCRLSYYKPNTDKPEKTNIYAYDGSLYQQLEGTKIIWARRTPEWLNLYRVWTLITAPFRFAFDKDDAIAFSTLRNPAKWTTLLGEIVAVEDSVNMLGHPGCTLKFRKPKSGDYVAVYTVFFAEDLGYMPLHTKVEYLEPADAPRAELVVTKTTTSPEGIVFPSAVQLTDFYQGDTRQATTTLTLVDGSLRINKAIPSDRFVIPKGDGVRLYDLDLETMVE